MQTCRIFLSSPSDVADARGSIIRTIGKVKVDWASRLAIEVIDWNEDYYTADSTFQKQIAQPSDCELVVCLFWKRLGSELPEAYRRTDGTLPTGTEFEFESAIDGASHHAGKLPDVLVYRKTADVTFSVDRFELEKAEYERFLGFWRRWFQNEKGHFTAAFRTFTALADLEALFESNLRRWLAERYGSVTWTKGNPFRGLSPFLEEHSEIFFGRRREIERARARLTASTLAGFPVLLVVGASGSGKSSLIRAGLMPRLKGPGGLPQHAIVASATVTPWEIAADWPSDLARALYESELRPGLESGDSPSVAGLAGALASGAGAGAIVGALNRLSRGTGIAAPSETSVLLLTVDQLEEVFAWPQQPAQRFFELLEALVTSHRVVLLTTIRSDFQHRIGDYAALARLAGRAEVRDPGGGERTIEIASPGESDLHEMIERPAVAAGLEFQIHDGRDLAALIKSEASAASMPAVELLLHKLYELRDGNQLTLAAYDQLEGVTGVMATLGESVLRQSPAETVASFPLVVRALVTQVRPGVPTTSRQVKLEAFEGQPAALEIVKALVDAGLVVSDRGAVRIAHEALLEHWQRVKDLVQQNQRLFEIRERLERDCARWRENLGRRSQRRASLLQGLSLEEGREILRSWGADSLRDREPRLPEFIEESLALERWRRWRVVASLLLVIAVVSSALFYAAYQARQTQISLWLANTQNALRNGDVLAALSTSRAAFDADGSAETRSAFIGALMQLSPHYGARIDTGAASPAAIAWIDASTLAYVDSKGYVMRYSIGSNAGGEKQAPLSLGSSGRASARVVALERTTGGGLLAVMSDGSLLTIANGVVSSQKAPHSAVLPTGTGSSAAISSDGALIALAPTEGNLTVLRCQPGGSGQAACAADSTSAIQVSAVAIDARKRIAVVDTGGMLSIQTAEGVPQGKPIAVAAAGVRIVSIDWNEQHNWLALGRSDGKLIVVDLDSEAPQEVRAGVGPVSAVAWSPDGAALAFSCEESSARQTEILNQTCLLSGSRFADFTAEGRAERLAGQQGRIIRLAWSPDGQSFASADASHLIVLWRARPNTQVAFDLTAATGAGESLAGSPNGKKMALALHDGSVRIWDAAKLDAPANLEPVSSAAPALAWSAQGDLGAIFADGTLAVWPQGKGAAQRVQLDGSPPELLRSGHIAWLGTRIAYVSATGPLLLAEPGRPHAAPASAAAQRSAESVAADPSGTVLVASHVGGQITWDVAGKSPRDLPSFGTVAPFGLTVDAQRRFLATTGGDAPVIHVFDLAKDKWLELTMDKSEPGGAIGFNPEGNLLAAVDADNELFVWQFAGSRPSLFLRVKVDTVAPGEFAKGIAWLDGDRIAVLTATGALRVLNLSADAWRSRMDALH